MVLRLNQRKRKKVDLLSSPRLLKTVLDPVTPGVWDLFCKCILMDLIVNNSMEACFHL